MLEEIRREAEAGYVSVQRHPTADLFIYNYAGRAQWENHWNPTIMACRGLILDGQGNVVARPFPKFFNFEQVADQLPAEPFEVFDKVDGSLGVLYRTPGDDEPFIATRGSFTSPQAREATRILKERYGAAVLPSGVTLLFEIIYPDNRIVVDYGDRRDLILLAAIETSTGVELPYESLASYGFPVVERFDGMADFDVVRAHNRDNSEGFVIRFAFGFRCKVKLAEYVRLHKLMTGLTDKGVWEHLRAGGTVETLADRVPDEFHAWVRERADGLRVAYDAIEREAPQLLEGQSFADRRTAAAFITTTKYPAILFSKIDGKSYAEVIWKLIKPQGGRAFRCDSDESPATGDAADTR